MILDGCKELVGTRLLESSRKFTPPLGLPIRFRSSADLLLLLSVAEKKLFDGETSLFWSRILDDATAIAINFARDLRSVLTPEAKSGCLAKWLKVFCKVICVPKISCRFPVRT